MTSAGIATPGPELEPKVKLIAARLSKMQRHAADEFIRKLLSSARAQEVFFADPNDMFYPYFLQQLTQFRNDTSLAESVLAAAQKEKEAAAAAATATATGGKEQGRESCQPPTVVLQANGTVVKHGGNVTEELLRKLEKESRRGAVDEYPDIFEVNRDRHAVELHPRIMGFMTVTAQYAAKYGPEFVEAVKRRHGETDAFRFLRSEDPRHVVFKELEVAYQTILCATDEEVEDRLDRIGTVAGFLRMCEDKSHFLRAEISRKKAALLTDDELRRRLEWDAFTTVQTFTLKDLGIHPKPVAPPTPPPATALPAQPKPSDAETRGHPLSTSSATASAEAIAPPPPPSAMPGRYLAPPGPPGGHGPAVTYMSSSLVRGTTEGSRNRNVSAANIPTNTFLSPNPPPVAASFGGGAAPRFIQPPSFVAAPATRTDTGGAGGSGVTVVENYETRLGRAGPSTVPEFFVDPKTGQRIPISAIHDHTAATVKDAALGGGKREREDDATVMASDAEYEANLLRRVKERV